MPNGRFDVLRAACAGALAAASERVSASTLSVLILAEAIGGDGFGAQRVADDEFLDQWPEDGGDGPGVGGGFDGDGGVGGEAFFGEGVEGFAGGGETGAVEDVALIVDEGGFDFFFVEIQTGKCHNSVTPFVAWPLIAAGRREG